MKWPAFSKKSGSEEAVLIYFNTNNIDDVFLLEEQLAEALGSTGEVDGNEIGGGEATIFLYGSDAETMYRKIGSFLQSSPLCQGARVVIRWGGPGSPQREVRL